MRPRALNQRYERMKRHPSLQPLSREHHRLDSNGALAIDDLASLAATLRAHIHWEERVFFPHLQSHVSTGELRFIGERLRDRKVSGDAYCDAFDDNVSSRGAG